MDDAIGTPVDWRFAPLIVAGVIGFTSGDQR
jgi:hypothetical protein